MEEFVIVQPLESEAAREYKRPKLASPFDFVKSATETKEYMFNEDTSSEYQSYIINRALSNIPDCLFFANEMNRWGSNIPEKQQYDFYFYSLDKKKRYGGWNKVEKNEDLELVMDSYGYSRQKAEQVISLLTEDQLTQMRNQNGGRIKNYRR